MLPRILPEVDQFIRSQRVAHLATCDGSGRPSVIPICYAYDGRVIYSAVDEKPKSVAPAELKRVKNIRANPEVSLVIDYYTEDWRDLTYVQIRGRARMIEPPG